MECYIYTQTKELYLDAFLFVFITTRGQMDFARNEVTFGAKMGENIAYHTFHATKGIRLLTNLT